MRQKIWDIASPLVCLLLCLLCATMVGTVFFGLLLGLRGAGSAVLLEVFPGLTLVITLIANLLALLLLRKSYQFDQARFGFNKNDWNPLQYLLGALLAASAGHIWSTVIYSTGIQKLFQGYTELSENVFQGQNVILLFLCTVVVASIAEEFVFRCLIYRRTKLYFGRIPAVLVSSLLFGLYHANVIQFLYATVFGILLVLIYEKSEHLLAPVLAHAGANLWAIAADYLLGNAVFRMNLVLLGAEAIIAAGAAWYLFKNAGKNGKAV